MKCCFRPRPNPPDPAYFLNHLVVVPNHKAIQQALLNVVQHFCIILYCCIDPIRVPPVPADATHACIGFPFICAIISRPVPSI